MPIKDAEDWCSRGLKRVLNEQIGVSKILSDDVSCTGRDLLTCETTLLTCCMAPKEGDCVDRWHPPSVSAIEAVSPA